jgi:hypothetical protein
MPLEATVAEVRRRLDAPPARHEQLTKPGAAERHAAGWRGAIGQLMATIATRGRELV